MTHLDTDSRHTRWRWMGVVGAALAVLVLGFALAACGDDEDEQPAAAQAQPQQEQQAQPQAQEQQAQPQPQPQPQAQQEEAPATGVVRIGSVQPLSGGGLAFYGKSEEVGLLLAVQQINEAGGFVVGDTTYTIEVVARDTRSDDAIGIAAVQELIRDEGIKIIFGPIPHGIGLAASELTQPEKVLHLMSLSILTSEGGVLNPETSQTTHKWLFQIEPSELTRSTITAAGVLELLGAEEGDTSVIIATDDPSGQFLGRFYNGVLTALGQKTHPVVFYPPGTTDFTPFLTRLKGLEPDWMHNWYIAADSVLIAEQALELEVARGYMVFGVDPGWWEENFPGGIDNEAPIVLACINLCRAIHSSERSKAHYEAVNEFECGNPDGCSPAPLTDITLWQYDYVFMLVEAMKKAGTVDDTTAIANALEGITIDGVLSSTLTMDPEWHRVAHGYDTCRVQLGEISCTNFSLEEYGPEALGVTEEFVLANQEGSEQ
ncbi:MAG: ABC transporter substrate-binding protein [Chloroflexota bacterium]|nr:ABC transporter substrate-binding protein [Chloroflexota bacterium]